VTKHKQESEPTQRKGKGWDIAKKVGIGLGAFYTFPVSIPYVALRNRVVAKEEKVHYAWGQVEIELQRRMDLIDLLGTSRILIIPKVW